MFETCLVCGKGMLVPLHPIGAHINETKIVSHCRVCNSMYDDKTLRIIRKGDPNNINSLRDS